MSIIHNYSSSYVVHTQTNLSSCYIMQTGFARILPNMFSICLLNVQLLEGSGWHLERHMGSNSRTLVTYIVHVSLYYTLHLQTCDMDFRSAD